MEQLLGLFDDSSTFFLEFEAEMFYKEQPWIASATGLSKRYRKSITPINIVAPTLFQNLQVLINNQSLCNYPLSEEDYFGTILNTDAGRYSSGDCIEQGFYKETAGAMNV